MRRRRSGERREEVARRAEKLRVGFGPIVGDFLLRFDRVELTGTDQRAHPSFEFILPLGVPGGLNRERRSPQILELGDDEVIVYYPHDRADYGLLGEAEVISENGIHASVQYFRTLVGCKGIAAMAQLKMLEIETGH